MKAELVKKEGNKVTLKITVDNNKFEEAVNKALSELKSNVADVLIVLAAPKFEHQKLLDGITSITKKTPMVGGTTAGEISNLGLSTDSVVVMALKSNSIK